MLARARPRARSPAAAAARRRGRSGRAGLARAGPGSDRAAGDCTSRSRSRRLARRTGTGSSCRRAEICAGKTQRPPTLRDRDRTVLERLPQRLEHEPRELGELVEQEHAEVGERRLARAGRRAAADDRRRRSGVMRGPERRDADEARTRRRARRRRSGSASPRGPPRRRAAAGAPGAGARASSCRCPAGRRAAGCGRPAAAISSTRLARSCPRTSARSGAGGERSAGAGSGRVGRDVRGSTQRPRPGAAPAPARCPARATSAPDSAAQTSRRAPFRRAPSAATREPGTGRRRPSSASSPTDAWPIRQPGGIWCEASSSASAIGRSKPEPSFRRSAGARLTMIRCPGHSSSADGDAAANAFLRLLAGAVGEPDDREGRRAGLEEALRPRPVSGRARRGHG